MTIIEFTNMRIILEIDFLSFFQIIQLIKDNGLRDSPMGTNQLLFNVYNTEQSLNFQRLAR